MADANLIAYLVLPGERTPDAEAVLARDAGWVVPALWRSELRSVVSQYVRRGDLSLAQGTTVVEQAEELFGEREIAVSSRDVLALAAGSKCSSYDCEYVALARALAVPLVTTDLAVLRAFPQTAVTPDLFIAGPPPIT